MKAKQPMPYSTAGTQGEDETFSVVSAGECTGMIPSAPTSAAEADSYGEIYDVPLSKRLPKSKKGAPPEKER